MYEEYGITANITETDRAAKIGSKAWLAGPLKYLSKDQYTAKWICRSRSGRLIKKWLPNERLSNFRCAWIPDHIRELSSGLSLRGSKVEMKKLAEELNEKTNKKKES